MQSTNSVYGTPYLVTCHVLSLPFKSVGLVRFSKYFGKKALLLTKASYN